MSYLSQIKADLKDTLDDAFKKDVWPKVERAIKESFKNGLKAQRKGVKQESSNSPDDAEG